MINVKNLVLGIGIIIVFALALWQGIEAFYPSPQYDDYCDIIARPAIINGTEIIEDDYSRCYEEYEDARDSHARPVFLISLIIGIIAIIAGYAILSIEPVGSALIGSGIWAIFWGSVVNWRNFSSIWRFLLLLLALILIIYITIRLNTRVKKK